MQTDQQQDALAAFQRGLETALRAARDGQSDSHAQTGDVSVIASLIERALATETSGETSTKVLQTLERVGLALEQSPGQQFMAEFNRAGPLNSVVSLAHDMRSPLTSILFIVETLRSGQGGAITPTQERQLGLVYGAAFGLSTMVNDVLLLARSERLGPTEPAAFSVSELLLSVQHIVEPIAEEKQLTISLTMPAVDARVGQPVMLGRVLLNLVTNALKFTEQGTVVVAVRELSEERVEFSVTDSGRGMPPELLPALFDAFRKVERRDGRTHTFSSAGLGLSICQTLVRMMDAELHVAPAPIKGTRFWFEVDLPAASAISG